MGTNLILLLLPALVHSHAQINIDIALDKGEVTVHSIANGSIVSIIDETDRKNFGIEDKELKQIVEKYSTKKPDDVFVKENDRWNLFKSYGWIPVSRIIKPFEVEVVNIERKEETLGEILITEAVPISKTVNVSVNNGWAPINDFTPIKSESTIVHQITTNKTVGALLNITFNSKLNVDSPIFERYDLSTGKPITAIGTYKLNATKCTIDLSVPYIVNLEGDVVCNYSSKREGHFFWAYDICKIQDEVKGMKKSVKVTENMKITFYYDLKAEIKP